MEYFKELTKYIPTDFPHHRLAGLLMLLGLIAFGAWQLQLAWRAPTIQSQDQQVLGVKDTPATLTLGKQEKTTEYASPVFEANFAFNALAPHWKEKLAEGASRQVEVRISTDGQNWTRWLEIEAQQPPRPVEDSQNEVFVENPIFIEGKFFQYRAKLSRSSLNTPSPEIYDFKINYINSRKTRVRQFAEQVVGFLQSPVRAEQNINVVSRKEWDSPDPYGKKFKGTNKYWPPFDRPAKQIFLHHTATSSSQSDPKAVVRGIWEYHAKTLGWGDIGYNYLVDDEGKIYEGRFGGDNTIGGHVRHYNQKSLGIGVLGCFQSTSSLCEEVNNGNTQPPSSKVLNGLTKLLSWKTTSFGINPDTKHTFCDSQGKNCLNLWTIAAHRDANTTTCNGDLFYDKMDQIRNDTATKNNDSWSYAADQLDFSAVDLRADKTKQITLSFKNMGTATWSNSTNRLLLKTANPGGRTSDFRHSSWLDKTTPAVLNETSVAPGETGSFTFSFKRPAGAFGNYFESLRLVSENKADFKNFYTTHLDAHCSFGLASNPRPNGTLIRNPGNGRIFWLEGGNKRHVTSPAAARTRGLNLGRSINVTSSELGLYTTGEGLGLDEGAVITTKSSPRIYILDTTDSGQQKRHIVNPKALRTFDLDRAKTYRVSKSKLDNLASGPALKAASKIPDGLVVKAPDRTPIYLIENQNKRRINNLSVYKSYRFGRQGVRKVGQSKIEQSVSGSRLRTHRVGTVVSSPQTNKVFAIETTPGAEKRWILSPAALTRGGFRWKDKLKVRQAMLDSYADGTKVACHK